MTYKDLALAEEEGKLEAALAESRNLLVEAPTGSGKSLFIPYFLSKHCTGRVVVLQPRRIAALALAQFSAKLHGEPCGKTVGYQFRQDSCKSAETRILFQTYGNFLQELLHGKMDADWIVFDEYHERKADMDLLFAFFNRRTPAYPVNREQEPEKAAPRIAVMSAALNREELEAVLGVKCLTLGHPLYPVQIIHQAPATGTSLTSGVGIDAEVVGKVHERSSDIIQKIKMGQIHMVINTLTQGKHSAKDGFRIRRATVEHGIACLTSLDTAWEVLGVLSFMRERRLVYSLALQDYVGGGDDLA